MYNFIKNVFRFLQFNTDLWEIKIQEHLNNHYKSTCTCMFQQQSYINLKLMSADFTKFI